MSSLLRLRRGAACTAGLLALAALPACGQEAAPAADSASTPSSSASTPSSSASTRSTTQALRQLERRFDARLGVYALDTGTGRQIAYRADDRFAYASTFKALAVGAVLRTHGRDGIDKVITYSRDDIIDNSPVTENFVKIGMSLRELSAATLWYSDNTAANLLLRELGGPDALEDVLEELGDDVTEMDRYEPELSDGVPGDTRDTSTPRALAGDLRKLLLGNALERRERTLLRQWMVTNTTGETLIAAGLPKDWTVADKSGTAGYGGRNDIAVVWPDDGGAPLVLAVLSSRDKQGAERRDELIADAAAIAVDGLGRRPGPGLRS